MDKIFKILEDIYDTVSDQTKVKMPNLFKTSDKRKSKSGVDGKYFKSQTNVSRSMISDQDREKTTEKGKVKQGLDDSVGTTTKILSGKQFEDLLNKSGDRSLDLSNGEEKSLNSKTSNYLVKKLPDGRVRIRKVK